MRSFWSRVMCIASVLTALAFTPAKADVITGSVNIHLVSFENAEDALCRDDDPSLEPCDPGSITFSLNTNHPSHPKLQYAFTTPFGFTIPTNGAFKYGVSLLGPPEIIPINDLSYTWDGTNLFVSHELVAEWPRGDHTIDEISFGTKPGVHGDFFFINCDDCGLFSPDFYTVSSEVKVSVPEPRSLLLFLTGIGAAFGIGGLRLLRTRVAEKVGTLGLQRHPSAISKLHVRGPLRVIPRRLGYPTKGPVLKA
jgi:hypothetical protein